MDMSPPVRSSADVAETLKFDSLKTFRAAGRGFWSKVSDADWNSWHWQLKNRITNLEMLERLMPTLTPEEHAGVQLANTKLAMAITPYFLNLIDPADEDCPIRRQVIPRLEETHTAAWEMTDPCGEDSHSPVPGPGASVSGSRALPGDRPLRRLLPVLHAVSAGEQCHRL